MSESLSEDELAELIRSGRINTSKSSAKKRNIKTNDSRKSKPVSRTSSSAVREVPRDEILATSDKALDPEWLKAEKERAERNIASEHQDKRRSEEMREASKF